MLSPCRQTWARQFAVAAVVSVSLLLAVPGPARAGYGPPPPTPAPVPGGFSEVVTSQSVGPAGKDLAHLHLDDVIGNLRIRRGTFQGEVQVTVTEPFVQDNMAPAVAFARRHRACGHQAGLGNAGFRGYCAIGGAGILVQEDGGSDFPGRYGKPMILRFSWGPDLHTIVAMWNGRRFVKAPHARIHGHSDQVRVHANGDFVVLERMRPHHR